MSCITNQRRYFAVKTKNGHTGMGKKYYMPIVYVVIAMSASSAAQQARQIPRVKHHKPDAVLAVEEISREKSLEIIEANRKDPYLQSANIQEQRSRISYDELLSRLVPEQTVTAQDEKINFEEKSRIYSGKRCLRKPHRFFHYAYDDCRLSRVN